MQLHGLSIQPLPHGKAGSSLTLSLQPPDVPGLTTGTASMPSVLFSAAGCGGSNSAGAA